MGQENYVKDEGVTGVQERVIIFERSVAIEVW